MTERNDISNKRRRRQMHDDINDIFTDDTPEEQRVASENSALCVRDNEDFALATLVEEILSEVKGMTYHELKAHIAQRVRDRRH
jgi:hypothetical protein